MSHFKSLLVFEAFYLLFSFSPIQAQFSFEPQPLHACRTFAITELGVYYRTTSPNTSGRSSYYITSDLGFMRNISSKYSLGLSHFIGFADLRGGIKFRIRRWLTDDKNIDISPGILLWDINDTFKIPGFTGSLDVTKEWFTFSAIFEYLRSHSGSKSDMGFYIGIKSGSYLGFSITAVGLVCLGVLFILSPISS